MKEEPVPEELIPDVQIKTAKKHYGNLYRESIIRVIAFSIPALIFTIASIWLYVKTKEGFTFRNITYIVPDYIMYLSIAAAIVCWGLFFWLKVYRSHKRAELWRKSMENYEALVLSESQFKTEQEKKEASRRSLKKAKKEIALNGEIITGPLI